MATPPEKTKELVRFLWIGAGFGVFFGFAELLIVVVRQRFFSDPMFDYTSHIAYTAPLLSGLAFALVSGGLFAVTLPLRPTIRRRVLGALLGALAGYGLTGVVSLGIHRIARLILAAGAALRGAGTVGTMPEKSERWMRRTAMVGALWILAVGGTALLRPAILEALKASNDDDRPNVLVLLLDTVRAQSLSTYGYTRETSPNLTRLAEGGTLFQRALAPSGYTHTSHSSLFTGLTPSELGIDQWTPLPTEPPTLAEILTENGYTSGAFMANVYFGRRYFGIDRGFMRYEHFPLRFGVLVRDSWLMGILSRRLEVIAGPFVEHPHKRAWEVRTAFTEWLDKRDGDRFFAFLNFMDAHTPRHPPAPYYGMYSDVSEPYQGTAPTLDSIALLTQSADNYDGSIQYLDSEIGTLLADLEARGVLENTLVVVTSDHGEQFGEHRYVDHGNSLYSQLLWVPLIVSMPGHVPAQRVVENPVTLLDVGSTILDYVNIEPSIPLGGESLRPLIEERASYSPERLLIGEGTDGPRRHLLSLVRDSLHLIRSRDGTIELFNFWSDPFEEVDLWNDDAPRPEWSTLRKEAEERVGGPPETQAEGPGSERSPA